MPVYSIMSKRQAVIKSENRDLFKRQKNGVWQNFQANKGGDEGSKKANNSLENKTYQQAGKEKPRKNRLTGSTQQRHGTKTLHGSDLNKHKWTKFANLLQSYS